MSNRLKTVMLMLGYLTFCSAFFGAAFTGYKTGDAYMFSIGLIFLLLAQCMAGVLIYTIIKTDRDR